MLPAVDVPLPVVAGFDEFPLAGVPVPVADWELLQEEENRFPLVEVSPAVVPMPPLVVLLNWLVLELFPAADVPVPVGVPPVADVPLTGEVALVWVAP